MRGGFASVALRRTTAHAAPMVSMRRIAVELERTIYVVAGLPIALRAQFAARDGACRDIRKAFARRYWRPGSPLEWVELALGIVLTPLVVPLAAICLTARNGPVIRRREGKGIISQLMEQAGLYFSAGILAPWYYIFSLHRDGERRAPTFLQRCETKWGVFPLRRVARPSPAQSRLTFRRALACHLRAGRGAPPSGRSSAASALHGCGGRRSRGAPVRAARGCRPDPQVPLACRDCRPTCGQ